MGKGPAAIRGHGPATQEKPRVQQRKAPGPMRGDGWPINCRHLWVLTLLTTFLFTSICTQEQRPCQYKLKFKKSPETNCESTRACGDVAHALDRRQGGQSPRPAPHRGQFSF